MVLAVASVLTSIFPGSLASQLLAIPLGNFITQTSHNFILPNAFPAQEILYLVLT